jgi:hypothetical protein
MGAIADLCAVHSFLLVPLHLPIESSRLHLGIPADCTNMADQVVLQLQQLGLLAQLLVSLIQTHLLLLIQHQVEIFVHPYSQVA